MWETERVFLEVLLLGPGRGDFEETMSQQMAASSSCCVCKLLSPGIPAGRSGAVCLAVTALSTADGKITLWFQTQPPLTQHRSARWHPCICCTAAEVAPEHPLLCQSHPSPIATGDTYR